MPPTKQKHYEFHFPSFIRWLILIVIFLMGLYFVMPKYELLGPQHRFNQVTGKVESYQQKVGANVFTQTDQ